MIKTNNIYTVKYIIEPFLFALCTVSVRDITNCNKKILNGCVTCRFVSRREKDEEKNKIFLYLLTTLRTSINHCKKKYIYIYIT